MQSKARMTIRFDPPAKPNKLEPRPASGQTVILERQPVNEPEALLNEPSFVSLNSPYQDDIHALEEIIRKTEETTAVSSVTTVVPKVPTIPIREVNPSLFNDKSFRHAKKQATSPKLSWTEMPEDDLSEDSWSLETTDPEEELSLGGGWYDLAPAVREEGPSWGRVLLSVTAAIATGALFGYLVLSLFTGEPMFPGKSNPASQLPVQASPGKDAVPSADASATAKDTTPAKSAPAQQAAGESSKEATTQVAAVVYYVLQYGVFKSEASMNEAVGQLKEKGLSSATETSDGYRVYVGAAATRDEATSLAGQMPDTEVYIKQVSGEPVMVSSGKFSEEGAAFSDASADLTRLLVQQTGAALQEATPQALEAADLSALREAEQQWLQTVSAVDRSDEQTAATGKAIVQSLNSAIQSMNEYDRKPSRYHLWNVQTDAMNALLSDRRYAPHCNLLRKDKSQRSITGL